VTKAAARDWSVRPVWIRGDVAAAYPKLRASFGDVDNGFPLDPDSSNRQVADGAMVRATAHEVPLYEVPGSV
jgi:hypothetical protein